MAVELTYETIQAFMAAIIYASEPIKTPERMEQSIKDANTIMFKIGV